MSSLKSTSKAVRELIICKHGSSRLMRRLQNSSELESYVQCRRVRTIGSADTLPTSRQMVGGTRMDGHHTLQNMSSGILTQRREFLGCGDGDEGSNVLSKVHEEKRIMGYSPEQLFAVVAAVDMYQDFLPWCQRSDIIRRHSDAFDAELEIGFKFLVESYVSHVQFVKPKLIKTTSSESNLFDHLINIWEFNPGPVPGTCDLHFFVDFKFQSPLYSQMASMFFKEVVSRLVNSFNERCRLIYGPGVSIHGKPIEQNMTV